MFRETGTGPCSAAPSARTFGLGRASGPPWRWRDTLRRNLHAASMPSSTQDPDDDFCAAALRLHDDMLVLVEAGRHDGAVYLSGYVQECSLKAHIERHPGLPDFKGKDLGHKVGDLSTPELCLRAVLGLRSPQALEAALTQGRVIDHKHPDRRYWPDHFTKDDADHATRDATLALRELVIRPMLDRGWRLPR